LANFLQLGAALNCGSVGRHCEGSDRKGREHW